MDPITIAAIAAAAQGAIGLGEKIVGGIKRRKAQKEFDANKFKIPSGVKSMLDVVGRMASQREMPGADIMRQRMGAATSQGVEAASRAGRSSSDVLGALQGLYGQQLRSQQDLAIQNAQNYQRNQLQYANALNTLGQYETQKWQYNTLYPYMQGMTEAGQWSAAGNENIGSALGSGLNLALTGAQLGKTKPTGISGLSGGAVSDYAKSQGMSMNQLWNATRPVSASNSTKMPLATNPLAPKPLAPLPKFSTTYQRPNYLGFSNPFNSK